MKIKIIDLLNKIANGEEVPKRIKYRNKIYHYRGDDYATYDEDWLFSEDYTDKTDWLKDFLTEEVEILDEEGKIERLDDNFSYRLKMKDILWNDNEVIIVNKINELIDEVNKLKEE